MDDQEQEKEGKSNLIFDKYFQSSDFRAFKEITCDGEEIQVVEQDRQERYLKLEYNSSDKRIRVIKEVYIGYEGDLAQSRERNWVEGKPFSVSIEEMASELPILIYRKPDESWLSIQIGRTGGVLATVGYESDRIRLVCLHECFSSEELNTFYPPISLKYLSPSFIKQNGGWTYEFMGESEQLVAFDEEIYDPFNRAFSYRMTQAEDGSLAFSGTQVTNGVTTFVQVPQSIDTAKWDSILWTDDRSWRDYQRLMEVSVGLSRQQ